MVAARGDLADIRLADRLFAPHYAAAVMRSVTARVPLRATFGGEALSEILPGEPFEVLELSKGHAWGASPVDGAVGFVEIAALGSYAEPATGDIDAAEDFVAVAEGLIGTPALAGGRSAAGLDGPGLVFLALLRAGIRAPRFVDLQTTIGHAVGDDAPIIRGDLIFAGGDIAIATDDTHVLRVNDKVEKISVSEFGPITARRRLP